MDEQRGAVYMPHRGRGRKKGANHVPRRHETVRREGRKELGFTHSHLCAFGLGAIGGTQTGTGNGKKTPTPALYFTLHCFTFFLFPPSLLSSHPSFIILLPFLILNSYPYLDLLLSFFFLLSRTTTLIMDVVPDVDHPLVNDHVVPDVIDSPSPTKPVQTPTVLSRLHLIDEEQKFRYVVSSLLTCKRGLFSLSFFFLPFRLTRMHLLLLKQT